MTRLDWDKTNAGKRVQRHGRTGIFMAEMPLSVNEMMASLAPKHLQASMIAFAWSVIEADLNQSKLPAIPEKLRTMASEWTLQRHINRRGGVLPFARWLLDADDVRYLRRAEEKKHERKLAELEKKLLHEAAKCELGLIGSADVAACIPDHLKGEIRDRDSLIKWAKSRPNYDSIVRQKNREMQKKHMKKRKTR